MSFIKRKIGKYWMWLNPKDHGVGHRLLAVGSREPCFLWMIEHSAAGLGLDVGANVGQNTLYMSKRCNKIIAIEPDVRSSRMLKFNLALNNIRCVTVLNCIVSDTVGTQSVYITKKPNLNSIMKPETKTNVVDTREFECTTIDKLLSSENLDSGLFIKMDIEGAEVKALRCAHKTLIRKCDIRILMELHPVHYTRNNNMKEQIQWLIGNGFHFKYIENAKGKESVFNTEDIVKTFPGHPRSVYRYTERTLPHTIDKCCDLDADGKKFVRSVLLEKLCTG
jgi:FkbM family methyltransferase